MFQLLKVEWMKVKHYRTFWVLSILYLVSVFGAIYIAHQIWTLAPKNNEMSKAVVGALFNFPDIWHLVSYISSFLMFMLGLLIIISFTNEYSYKTHRQNIIDGWSRKEFILVKIALTIIVALAATVAVFITALLFGLQENATSFTFEKIEFIGYFFIQAVSYCSAALLFSLLFKRSGITIGVFFLYTLILENMLTAFLNHYTDNFGRYLPLETTDNLIRIPFGKAIINQFMASFNTPALLIMATVYLALYYFISVKKFESDDL
ncbi:ABC transporter permease [Segetibacter sp.]|jgi:ABC-2 type transport system permease protein|uniref:ABC transporter permease n=1 Tax=Segetibacter sp. TaxID=2231182 RepID=UPI0026148AE3|nr:ABC transporter permease [Segetibacter sp.]MCW3080040.1 transporter permease subunit [Segetibacter sp.]